MTFDLEGIEVQISIDINSWWCIILTRYCINIAVSMNFNIIHIGQFQEANMEIILKWVQTAILTAISNLLYSFCITRLKTNYLFCSKLFVFYLCKCASKCSELHNCVSKKWCQNRSVWLHHIMFNFKGPHVIGVLNNYSVSANSGDLETEWWGVRIVE